jgi:hypothetical protein
MKSLFFEYRHENKKAVESKKFGSGDDDIKAPKYFAYQLFIFLDGIKKPRKTEESRVILFTLIEFLLTHVSSGYSELSNSRQ